MRRIINWFKFVFNIQNELKKRDKTIEYLQDIVRRHNKDITLLESKVVLLESLVDVGVDVHQRSPSWAVICINGKSDFIKFYQFKKQELVEIKKFLKQFEKANKVIDVPFNLPKDFFL